jgi:hypothetical protein
MSSFPSGLVLRSGILQSSFDVLVFDDIRIGHLFVDQFNDITILFVITLDGLSLRKYSLLINQNLCLLENIPLKSPSIPIENWKVNKAEFISKTVSFEKLIYVKRNFFFSSSERNNYYDTFISFKNSCCTLFSI